MEKRWRFCQWFGALLIGIMCVHSPAAAGTVESLSFYYFTDRDGQDSLIDRFKVTGIAPWNLGPVSMTTPSGFDDATYPPDIAVNYDQEYGSFYGPLLFLSMYPPEEGTYTYAFYDEDNDALTGSPQTHVYSQNPLTAPDLSQLTTASLSGDELYIGTTTPTLAWQPADADTSLYYRAVITPYNDSVSLWTSGFLPYSASMSVDVPSGILASETAYRWAVEVYDADTLATAGNGASSAAVSFYTGAAGQPVSISQLYSRSRVRSSRYETQFAAIITGAAPWDVSIEVTGQDGSPITTMDGSHYSSDGYWSSYQSPTSDTNLAPQTFSFTVSDLRSGASPSSITGTSDFTPNWAIIPHDEDSMFQVNYESSIANTTPTFTWEPRAGVSNYRVQIFSYAVEWSYFSREQLVWTGDWTTGLSTTVPTGILEADSAYMWRVETSDALGNRGRGDLVSFFVADTQAPLSVSGDITMSDIYTDGNLIHIEATDSPVFPGGTNYAFVHITPTELPANYTLYNLPHTNPVYIHALWDHDGSHSYSVGDRLGVQFIDTSSATDPVTDVDVDLSAVVPSANSFTGTISCPEWQSGYGDIHVIIFNEGEEDEIVGTATLTAPGSYQVVDTSQIPVGGYVFVQAFWDTDGSGDLTPTDQTIDEDDVHVLSDTVVDLTITIQGKVSGTVFEEDGITPASGKLITVTGVGNDFREHLFTGEDGTYSLTADDGQYRVSMSPYYNTNWEFNPNQYLVLFYNGKYDYNTADLVTVDSANPGSGIPYVSGGIDFVMQQGVYISGQVVDSGGNPLADIAMEALDENENMIGDQVVTGPDGMYSLLVPPNGSYYVFANPQGGWQGPQPYINQYWGDVEPWNDPPNVEVVTDPVSDINFTLIDARIVSGTVLTDVGGEPIADLWVEAWDYDTGDVIDGGNTDEYGVYTIFVPPGRYRVMACPTCNGDNPQPYLSEYYDDAGFDDAAEVNTETEDQYGINFSLADGMFISGTVIKDDGGEPLANLWVEAFDYSSGAFAGGANTDTDGNYAIVVAPGRYKVSACPTCSWDNPQPYLAESYNDTDFDNAAEVNVETENQSNIDFSLADAAVIRGAVTQTDGTTSIENLWVEAFDHSTGLFISGSNTRNDGSYYITVPEGTYKVRACASCNNPFYIDQNYDGQYHESYTPVSVSLALGAEGIDFSLSEIVMGDINGDEQVDLTDAVLGLKIMTGSDISEPIFNTGDVDENTQVGLPEVIYILNESVVTP